LLGTSLSYQGLSFPLGPANAPDALANETIPIAPGQYTQLYLLGAGVNGAQAGQTVIVTYTDGSSSTFTQSFSDWAAPQSFPGETTVSLTANRITPTGTTLSESSNVYGYTFPLTPGKTLASVKLPATRNVVFLGIGLGTSGLRYVPVTPCRVADTRNATGTFGGPILAANTSRSFPIPASACGIPATAQAYALNITVVPSGALSGLYVFATGQAVPTTALLVSDGRIKSNAAIVAAGTSGGVSLRPTQNTQAVIDITGYFVPASNTTALEYFPVAPCRAVNYTYIAGGATSVSMVSSACKIPSTVQAYSVNITAQPTNGTLNNLYVWPTGKPQPAGSILSAPSGTLVGNTAIVGAGTGGQISILPSANTQVFVDINGYYAPAGTGGLALYTVPQCRAINGVKFVAATVLNIAGSACKPPATAQAYVLNSTVQPSYGYMGSLILWANGAAQPGTSNLYDTDGSIISNGAVVTTTNGSIDANAQNQTTLWLDINGYFAP
jgi:hypothetical protein